MSAHVNADLVVPVAVGQSLQTESIEERQLNVGRRAFVYERRV